MLIDIEVFGGSHICHHTSTNGGCVKRFEYFLLLTSQCFLNPIIRPPFEEEIDPSLIRSPDEVPSLPDLQVLHLVP